MGLWIFCISPLLFSIALFSFYMFPYIDGWLLFPVAAAMIVSVYTTKDIIQRKILIIFIVMIIGLLIGYHSGFRFQIFDILQRKEYGSVDTTQSLRSVEKIANTWNQSLIEFVSKDSSSLIVALLTGKKEYLNLVVLDLVRRNGVSHLLALSGFHLSILILIANKGLLCIERLMGLKIHRGLRNSVLMSLVWAYCLWIGFVPSLYRAAIMFSVSLFCENYFGRRRFIEVWSITGMLFILATPSSMYRPGFILSMLALLGVVYGAEGLKKLIPCVPFFITMPLGAGVGAVIMSAWYSFLYFKSTYIVGIMVSILLTPLVMVLMLFGGAELLLLQRLSFAEKLIYVFAWIIDGITNMLIAILHFFGRSVVIDSWTDIIMFYLYVIGIIMFLWIMQYIVKLKKGY